MKSTRGQRRYGGMMNDKKDAALRRALDALTVCEQSDYGRNWVWPESARASAMQRVRESISAINDALAEPQGREWWAPVICPPDSIAFLGTDLYPTRQAAMTMATANRHPIIDAVRLA